MDTSDKMSVKKAMELSLDEYIAESGLYDMTLSKKRRSAQNKNSNVDKFDAVVEDIGINYENETDLTINQQQNHVNPNFQESSNQRCSTLRYNGVYNTAVTQSLSMNNPFRSLYPRKRKNRKRNQRGKNKNNKNNNNYNSNIFEEQHKRNGVYMQNRDNNYNNIMFQPSLSNVSRALHMLPNDITATDLNVQSLSIPNFTITNNQRNQSFMRPLQYFSGINQFDLMNDSNTNLQTTMFANTNTFGNINAENMAYLTSKFLEFINSNKPKYDMRIQKEIHSIQGKRMVYRCNGGGDIVSSDGPGLNCVLQPAVTGLTLNQRFA